MLEVIPMLIKTLEICDRDGIAHIWNSGILEDFLEEWGLRAVNATLCVLDEDNIPACAKKEKTWHFKWRGI